MRPRIVAKARLAWCLLASAALSLPARPAHARRCTLEAITVSADTVAQRITLKTGCVPHYQSLRLAGPDRLVVDLADVDAEGEFGHLPVDAGMVSAIAVQAIEGPSGPIGRVVIGLRTGEAAKIHREGQDIVVHLEGGRLPPPAPPEVPSVLDANGTAQAQAPAADANAPADANANAPSAATPLVPADANGPSVPPAPPAELPAVDEAGATDPTGSQAALRALLADPAPGASSAAAEAPAAGSEGAGGEPAGPAAPEPNRPATFLGLRRRGAAVVIELDRATRFDTQMVPSPARFVVDLPDARAAGKTHSLGKRPAWLSRVRLGHQSAGIRLVFDLRGRATPHVHADERGLRVDLAAEPSHASVRHGRAQPLGPHVSDVHFDEASTSFGHEARIFVALSSDQVVPEVDTTNPHAFVLALPGVALPGRLERGLDTRASRGPVSLVSSFQAERHPPTTHIVVNVKGPTAQRLQPTEGGLTWMLRSQNEQAEAPAVTRAMSRHAGYAEDAAPAKAGSRLRTARISLDVKDADVANVLRLISEETGENIIASDEVHGKVTLKLRNVPAEQALDTLLRVKGFDKVRTHNILRIASAETIQKERDAEVARRRATIEVEDVVIKMVTINYATAAEVVEQLKPMLSGRGSVQVDARTNTLILQDIASNIDNLAELARRLDKQTPLVNIQARIVEADSTFVRDLGVQWGGAVKHTAVTGNPTGLYFPADVTAQGAADLPGTAAAAGGSNGATVAPARYAVNLPASLTGPGAALGFILGSAGGAQLLDLRLSAMETNGNGKVISSPEVSTLDNRTAKVSQGMSFAVSTVSAAGTNVRFVEAVLELEVTPHVTNDGTVLLKLHIKKDAPDFSNRSGQGDPSIQKKEAQTEVLVRDGDTSVIGGILTRNTTESRNEVPFLSKIPLLGLLFREHSSRDSRSELLVFITPRIINRNESRLGSDVAINVER